MDNFNRDRIMAMGQFPVSMQQLTDYAMQYGLKM